MPQLPTQYFDDIYYDLMNGLDIASDHATNLTWSIVRPIQYVLDQMAEPVDNDLNAFKKDIENFVKEQINNVEHRIEDDIDIVEDRINDEIDEMWIALAELEGTPDDVVIENLTNAYESVQQSHELVNTNLSNQLDASTEAITESHEEVSSHMESVLTSAALGLQQNQQMIEESMAAHNETLFATIMGIVQSISGLPSTIFATATDLFLPVMGIVFNDVFNNVLLGNPLAQAIKAAMDIVKNMFTDLLTFDEDEMVNLVKKLQKIFTDHLSDVIQGPEV